MGAIDKILERISSKHPELKYVVKNQTITVKAPTPEGFDVWFSEVDWTVGYEGWHEHFGSEQEALQHFAYGFSGQCRLKVDLRGSFAYRWTREFLQDGEWIEESTTGLLFVPIWRRKRTAIKENPPLALIGLLERM